ncbi:uncharacterized protein T551_02354 [Pneumocystis jirovecii RU7]|uniref:Uncharacterized protein n=1 Tax=Pneumocystis jirovecii (strain RU7) TaxID=1408657 RepID=A0A0W4ZL42_PNEJ7|nr:uncharacterized protein T551_02354 [Pneumocystis jirovecii RU7]KTW29080.1 hypothetical protein T551_02354 [Pneumocystis jirovecii RU7]
MSGFFVLMISLFLSRFFHYFFNTYCSTRHLNSTNPLKDIEKYKSALSFLFKPFISSIIPDTNSLAQKLYTDSIERIQRAIKTNELEILYVLGTEKPSFGYYEAFSILNINGLSNFSINFKIHNFYKKNDIASVTAYGTMDKYNIHAVLKKISISNNNGEKIVLYNDSSFKTQGKTIDAEYWTSKSVK